MSLSLSSSLNERSVLRSSIISSSDSGREFMIVRAVPLSSMARLTEARGRLMSSLETRRERRIGEERPLRVERELVLEQNETLSREREDFLAE